MSLDALGKIQSKEYSGKRINIQAAGAGTNYIDLSVGASAADYSLKFPDAAPSNNQILKIDSVDAEQFTWDTAGGAIGSSISVGRLPNTGIMTVITSNSAHTWTDAELISGMVKRESSGNDVSDVLGGVITATSLRNALALQYPDLQIAVGTYWDLIVFKDAGLCTIDWTGTGLTKANAVDATMPDPSQILPGNVKTIRFLFTDITGAAEQITIYSIGSSV